MSWLCWPFLAQLPKNRHKPKKGPAHVPPALQLIPHPPSPLSPINQQVKVQEDINARLTVELATTKNELAQNAKDSTSPERNVGDYHGLCYELGTNETQP